MNIITQEAMKCQAVVKCAMKKGKSRASRMYGVSLSSVKRWCKRYDGTWQSLKEKSHRPNSHPKRHTAEEEELIRKCFLRQHRTKTALCALHAICLHFFVILHKNSLTYIEYACVVFCII